MMQELLDRVVAAARPCTAEGKVATYIPRLADADPHCLGAYIMNCDGEGYGSGDWQHRVTIQSISKVAIFLCVLQEMPLEQLQNHLSLNATAESFNSLTDLEKNDYKPLNPYINAGAMVGISLLQGSLAERLDKTISMLKAVTGNSSLAVNEDVFLSEKISGNRNRAIAYFLKSTNIIHADDVEALLDVYFRLCSVEVDCRDLACFATTLVNNGVNPLTMQMAAGSKACRTALSVMVACGLYNQSGEFLVRAGLPAKSGVSGAIMATGGRRFGIGAIGPALNKYANSAGGIMVLEQLAHNLNLSII